MTLAYDIVVAGILAIVAVIIHVIGVELFAPGTALYQTASQATNLNGAERASFWSEFFVVWLPIAIAGTGPAWVFIRAYRRQAITAYQRAP